MSSRYVLQVCPPGMSSRYVLQVCPPGMSTRYVLQVFLQSCPPVMSSRYVLQSCPPGMSSSHVLQVCPPGMSSRYVLQVCLPGMSSRYNLQSCPHLYTQVMSSDVLQGVLLEDIFSKLFYLFKTISLAMKLWNSKLKHEWNTGPDWKDWKREWEQTFHKYQDLSLFTV
jgi:hypothetical protein